MKIKLLGELGRKFGREFSLSVNTASEAIRLLTCQIDGMAQFMIDSSNVGSAYQGFRVCNPGKPDGYDVDELDNHVHDDVIVIAPMISGSGGSFGKILLGVALIGVAVLVPFAGVGGGTSLGLLGASLVLSGISQLLAPKPKNKDSKDDSSNLIDRAGGTATQGIPVPLLLGRKFIMLDSSKVLSASLTANERLVIPPAVLRSAATNTYIVSSPPGTNVIGAW
jgi:predicted phage tail protein